MPVPTKGSSMGDSDTYSLLSQATTTMTIGDSLPAQLVRKSTQKGFTFNIMSVGPRGLGKTTILSALFGKNLRMPKDNPQKAYSDPMNPPIEIESKTFEIDEKKIRLKLTLVESKNYGEAINSNDVHLPLVQYIDNQFADYSQRESGVDRRTIQDKMVHCLFFFISPIGHGLSRLDLEFLKAVHERVNLILIIAKSEALTVAEKASFKQRVKDDLEKNNINVYKMPDPDHNDNDEIKRFIKEIQDSIPFAVSSMMLKSDNTVAERHLGWGKLDPNDKNHSDFLMLKTMLHMQMPDLCDTTHEIFYENYRLSKRQRDGRRG